MTITLKHPEAHDPERLRALRGQRRDNFDRPIAQTLGVDEEGDIRNPHCRHPAGYHDTLEVIEEDADGGGQIRRSGSRPCRAHLAIIRQMRNHRFNESAEAKLKTKNQEEE